MSLCDLFFDKVIDNVLCTAVVLGWDSYPGGSYVSYFHDLSFSCCWSDSFSKNSTYFCCNALRTATRRMGCRKPGLIGLCWRMQAILEWYNARKKSSKRVQVRRRVMSMYARELGTIPEETVRVAHAACPKGTLAMRLRDALGELYQDEQFAALYPVEGQP